MNSSFHQNNNSIIYQKDSTKYPNLSNLGCFDFNVVPQRIFSDNTNIISSNNPYLEDIMRITNSQSFYRTRGKTQVFRSTLEDHVRNRMTHSIHASNIAKIISESLGLNHFLAECIAISHDIGHPPFGHQGEETINEIIKKHGLVFCHNMQLFNIVTKIDKFSPFYDGLNLNNITLECMLQHHGKFDINNPMSDQIMDYNRKYGNLIDLDSFPNLECQIANISDDISYVTNDIYDSYRKNALTIDEILQLEIIGDIFQRNINNYPQFLEPSNKDFAENDIKDILKISLQELMKFLIDDLTQSILDSIKKFDIKSYSDIKSGKNNFSVNFSEPIRIKFDIMKKNAYKIIINSDVIAKPSSHAHDMLIFVFEKLKNNNSLIISDFWKQEACKATDEKKRIQILINYIAGMTDSYLIRLYEHFNSFNIR